MMGWLLGCFRVAGYSGEGRRERERDQLVSSPSVSPPVDAPKVCGGGGEAVGGGCVAGCFDFGFWVDCLCCVSW